jgi:PAS domain S-box-containing protein
MPTKSNAVSPSGNLPTAAGPAGLDDETTTGLQLNDLRKNEERFRTLCDNMSVALAMIDANRKITYWNQMCELTSGGIARKDAIGSDALLVLPFKENTLEELIKYAGTAEGIKRRIDPEREGVTGTYDIRAFTVGSEIAFLIEDVTLQVRQAAELDRSNHHLLDLYHNAPCGYLSVMPDGKIDRMNLRMAEWLGYQSHEGLVRLNIEELLTKASFDHFKSELSHASIESPLNNLELEFKRRNGDLLIGLVNALPIFDPVLRFWYWRWTVIDVTELRAAQKQIEDSRLFSQLFNELGEAVLISDRSGKIVRANHAASRILGMTNEYLTSIDHDDANAWEVILDDGTRVPPEDFPAVRALRDRKPVTNLELGVRRPDGSIVWILESAAPLFNNQGEVTGVIVTFPEVTATVLQRQKLTELNDSLGVERDRANEANRLKSSFLANMSHEIRTPMTAILGFSDILSAELSGKVSEQHYTFLRSINVSGKRLLNLINDILDLSKIEAGRLELQNEEIDLRQEIDASVAPLAFIAKQKGLALNIEQTTERFAIKADRQRLNQVMTNIISNAIKFTRHGSINIKLTSNDGKLARVDINDTGIGISDKFLPHLFEEFRQEHTGVTKEFGGTGLGLTISKRLVNMMGGTIEVTSQVGVGTTFSLTFPLITNPTTAFKPAILSTPAFAPPAIAPNRNKDSSEKRLVLVVEDNVETQRLLDVYLKQQYRVAQAMNATEAFAAIDKDVPDVILMDVNLPGKDGLTITREIRGGDQCPGVPIVALTAFAMTGDRQRCLDAGCNDYLSKPATKREVLEVLERVMRATANS